MARLVEVLQFLALAVLSGIALWLPLELLAIADEYREILLQQGARANAEMVQRIDRLGILVAAQIAITATGLLFIWDRFNKARLRRAFARMNKSPEI